MSALALHAYGPDLSQGGVPLVLLHGFPLDSRMWSSTVALLPGVPILAVDAPGFGDSEALEDDEPSLDLYANAVVSSLNDAGVVRAVVVGLSMGGYVALSLAERHPQVLAGLALLDTKAKADDDAGRQKRLDVAEAALGEQGSAAVAPMIDTLLGPTSHRDRSDLVEEMRAWLDAAPPEGIAWAQEAMAARPDRLDVLRTVQVPSLVLRGAEDTLSTAEDHARMAEALGVDVVVVAGAGHMSALEDPEATARALGELYARVTGSGD